MSQGKDVNKHTRTICPKCTFNPKCRQCCIFTSSIFPVPSSPVFSLLPLCLFDLLDPLLGTLSPPSDRHGSCDWLAVGREGRACSPARAVCLAEGSASSSVSVTASRGEDSQQHSNVLSSLHGKIGVVFQACYKSEQGECVV